ncbi:hypothetical protein HDU93_007366 [Gonapodya sp. JEL0774]|nr:hypothetical protein HDU93_007366 [Gonapodya sp. JEL0774]
MPADCVGFVMEEFKEEDPWYCPECEDSGVGDGAVGQNAKDSSADKSKKKRRWDLTDTGEITPPSSETPPNGNSEKFSNPSGNEKEGDADNAKLLAAQTAARLLEAKGISVKSPASPDALPTPAVKRFKASGDGDFTRDIDINDLKNRYVLTKSETQKAVKEYSSADIVTRGRYYPDRKLADKEPPLYLHITATTQEALDKAVEKVQEFIDAGFGPAQAESQPSGYGDYPRGNRRDMYQEKVYVEIDDRMFSTRAKVVGPGGQFVKHIQNETSTRVQLKGRGSGYIEVSTQREADDDLHVHIAGSSAEGVNKAKLLVQDLVDTVKEEYQKWKQARTAPPMRPSGMPGQAFGAVPGAHFAPLRPVNSPNQQYPPGVGYPGAPTPNYSQGYYAPPPGATQTSQPVATGQAASDPYSAYYQQYYAQWYAYYGQQQPDGSGPAPAPPQTVPDGSNSYPPPPPTGPV